MRPRSKKGQIWLAVSGVCVALLLAAVFTLGSLNVPIEPRRWDEVVVLYALSTFIVAALLVFGLILARNLVRLWAERRAEKLGARFKTKMVVGAMAISLLPVVFLFWVSYALLNRTLNKWFSRPLEIASQESQKLLDELGKAEYERLRRIAYGAIGNEEQAFGPRMSVERLRRLIELGGDAAWVLGPTEQYIAGVAAIAGETESLPHGGTSRLAQPRHIRELPSGAEIWEAAGKHYLACRIADIDSSGGHAKPLGSVLVARLLPEGFLRQYTEIETQFAAYSQQKQQLRTYKTQMLLVLLLFTLLLLFAATWFALFLSKQVTVPIQALAEATREVSLGKFDQQVNVQAQDELGILVRSFNQMTAQLGDSRRRIDEFTRNLQQAVQELERRRKLIEAILENVPTGVLSLDTQGNILRINSGVVNIFGEAARVAEKLETLMGEEAARGVQQLMRRSLRMGVASKELEIALPGRLLHAAVTVSSLGPRRSNLGFVVVVDDLTELLRAQKAAAWQEVAQRIAHEIRNPLTPIQLSAQRLARYLDRKRSAGTPQPDEELAHLVGECSALIEREAAALKELVDEFWQFARFPTARPVAADVNAILASALEVFGGRLEGITVRTTLAKGLPSIKGDPELLRRVVVNLIDNAAEAMENSAVKELAISSRLNSEGETVEIVVADTGHGISPEDKDKLFLPHFSTRTRGTGLGLAIAGRILEEHHGTIRVEDNVPLGSRFILALPLAEVPAVPLASET